MQQIECARSLLICRQPPTVQSFSPATTIIMYSNKRNWDFKGQTSVKGCNQRKREYGMRTQACLLNRAGEDALTLLKKLIIPEQKSEHRYPILYDGSTKEEVDIDVLEWKNLFLLFSKLKIERQVINSLRPVHEKLQEDHKGVIVWIPVVKDWTDSNKRYFEDLRTSEKMPWYTIKTDSTISSPFQDIRHKLYFLKKKIIHKRYFSGEPKWYYTGEPILTVMDKNGDVGNWNALPLIRKEGIDAFPFST